jgi:rare lipoprotein A
LKTIIAALAATLSLAVPAEAGKASWYGPGFHGRLTASGERYDQHAMTCAHKTLRFGTRVKVTNLHNGKSAVCRVTDRGPFVAGRVIDVSRAMAARLGMIRSGVAPVSLQILK